MMSKIRVGIAATATGLSALLILHVTPATAGRRWGPDYFTNVELITHEGKTVRFYDDLLKGKSVAVNVIYTSCKDECPLETARLAAVQKLLGDRMGKEIFFYSISIDPKRDTPEALKAYAKRFKVGPGWLFLTGTEKNIQIATKKLGLKSVTDNYTRDGHRPSLMVGDVARAQWTRQSAVENPQFLATTIGNFLGWKNREPAKSYAEVRPVTLEQGAYLFQARCSNCHSIGGGPGIGPDLMGMTHRRDRDWLARYIQKPDQVLAEGDPIAKALSEQYKGVRMPNLDIGSDQAAELISYMEARSAEIKRQEKTSHHEAAAHHH